MLDNHSARVLLPRLFHDILVFGVQVVYYYIKNDTNDFRVETFVGAWQASIEEYTTIICCYVFEYFVAAIQVVQVFFKLCFVVALLGLVQKH